MRNMFKSVMLAVALIITPTVVVTASANDCSLVERIAGLDEVSKRQMIVKCEQTKLEAQERKIGQTIEDVRPTEEKVLDTMDRVSQIALQFAKAIGVAAKELGVAVNEFITTPAGLMTIVFLIYQFAGSTIVYLALAGFALVFIFRTLRKFIDAVTISSWEEKEVKGWFGNTKIVRTPVRTRWKDMGEGQTLWTILVPIAEIIAVIVLVLNIPT